MYGVRLRQFATASSLPFITLSHSIPIPPIPPRHLRVRIAYASVNPSDSKNILHQMPHTKLPIIVGRDFSGWVDAIGDGVDPSEWPTGTAVWGTGGDFGFLRDGSHAQYITLSSSSVARKPSSLTFAQAASAGVNFVTAYSGLYLVGGLSGKEEVVLVTGANGGVGSAVRQLAVLTGATVISVDRSRPKEEKEKEKKDNHQRNINVFLSDYPNGFSDLPAAVAALPLFTAQPEDAHHKPSLIDPPPSSYPFFKATGKGPSLVFDSIGGPSIPHLLHLCASNGRVVNIATHKDELVPIDLFDMYRRQIQLRGANSLYLNGEESAEILQKLQKHFEEGVLRVSPIGEVVDLTPKRVEKAKAEGKEIEVGEVYQRVLNGARGKVLLQFHDVPNGQ